MATLIKSTRGDAWRFYKSGAARKSALTQMRNHGRYNYFVLYTDVKGPAMHAARAAWVKEGTVHVDRKGVCGVWIRRVSVQSSLQRLRRAEVVLFRL